MKNSFNKEILKLAVPSILANITIPFVGMVDLGIAGHLHKWNISTVSSATLIGAIAIGTMLFDILYWNFSFLRIGTGGLTAQAFGREDKKELSDIFSRSIGLALLVSFFIILLQKPFIKVIFSVIDCSEDVKNFAIKYFFIRIWAAPATLCLMGIKGWFIGLQDSFSSMITDLAINIINVVVSFVLSLKLGFDGIAFGTVIAQFSGLLIATLIIFIKYKNKIFNTYTLSDFYNSFKGEKLFNFLHINSDLFVRSACMLGVYIGFTLISAKYGDLMLASSSIMMKLLLLFSYFTDGFAYAGEAMTGKYIGKNSLANTKKTIKYIFIWSMGIGLSFIVGYYTFGEWILELLSSEPLVIDTCKKFFFWLLPMPLIGCAAFTWDGIYTGATDSKAILYSSLYAFLSFLFVWFVGRFIIHNIGLEESQLNIWAIHLLMAAYFAHLLARTLYLSINYKKMLKIAFKHY